MKTFFRRLRIKAATRFGLTQVNWLCLRRRERWVTMPDIKTQLVQIVCGDCVGEGSMPRITYETRDARCSGCHGRAYVRLSACQPRTTALAVKLAAATGSEMKVEGERILINAIN